MLLTSAGLPSLTANQPPPLEPAVMLQPITSIAGRDGSKESREGWPAAQRSISMPSKGGAAG